MKAHLFNAQTTFKVMHSFIID